MNLLFYSYDAVFFGAFGIACITIVGLRPIASIIGLVDKPNIRKKHLGDIPLIGGIAIYFTIFDCNTTFFTKIAVD